jgi:hypothetical protein
MPRVIVVVFLSAIGCGATATSRSCAIAAGLRLRALLAVEGMVYTWPLTPLICRPSPAPESFPPPPLLCCTTANISKVQSSFVYVYDTCRKCLTSVSIATFASAKYLAEGGTPMPQGDRIAAMPGRERKRPSNLLRGIGMAFLFPHKTRNWTLESSNPKPLPRS